MRKPRTKLAALAAMLVVGLVAAGCGSGGSSSTSSSGAKTKGGTAVFAFNAGGGANYIFPILPP
jgi:ABC-type glycerol-3-phosphate transport system substrate-binding protein